MCGRPFGRKQNLWTGAARDRVLPWIRPATGHVPPSPKTHHFSQLHKRTTKVVLVEPVLPGKIAAQADVEEFAQTLNGEVLLRLIDELEFYRRPSSGRRKLWLASGAPTLGAALRSRAASASIRQRCPLDGR